MLKMLGKARPQIPLEAMISGKRIGLYKTNPRELIKSLESAPYALIELTDNTDEDRQAFIGALSMDDEIEIRPDAGTGEYFAYCGSIEFGRLDNAAVYDLESEDNAVIQKIELNKDGIFTVSIVVAKG